MLTDTKIILRNNCLKALEYFLKSKSLFNRKKTLIIVRLDAIGDYILFRNFLKTIKESKKFKEYKIVLCGNLVWKDLSEKYDKDYIDEFIWIDKTRFRKKSEWIYSSMIMLKLHLKGFEILIEPNDVNSRISEYLIKRSGVRNVLSPNNGFIPYSTNNGHQYKNLYDGSEKQDLKSMFMFYRNKNYIEKITGEKVIIEKPYFNNVKRDQKEKYIVIFPGAGNNLRKWSSDNYAVLCNIIIKDSDFKILICGNENDKEFAKKIIQKTNAPNIEDWTGKTNLSDLVEIISDASLIISNETCAVHIGAAVNTKTICISNGNHFGRFNPYPEEIAPFVKTIYPMEVINDKDNYSTLVKKYFISSNIDINTIEVSQVIDQVKVLLEHEKIK